MMTKLFFGLLLLASANLFAQDKPAYRIFDSQGNPATYADMINTISSQQIIFVGELHNDPIAHWMELQITESVYDSHPDLALAMEMFEADDQIVLTEYLTGKILEDHLLKEAKVWKNYATDYKPLIEFAKQHKLPVIASNVPRRYANLVYRRGLPALDSLADEAKNWMAPLPIEVDMEVPSYKNMFAAMGGHEGGDHPVQIVHAQALKDATMAHFILENKKDSNTIIHFNGSYHTQNHEGIIWYVNHYKPGYKIKTVQIVEQDDISKVDESNLGLADFIICVPSDMTKTY